MKPVDQQVLHDPDNGLYGDCQRACIASLLDLEPADVPHFHETDNPATFWRSMNSFLAERGLFHLTTGAVDFDQGHFLDSADCYHMIYGRTERGTLHAVVALNGEIVHDPHPSKAGLLESERDDWDFAFLVKAI